MPSLPTRELPPLYPLIAVACVVAFGCAVWSGEVGASWAATPAGWLATICAVLCYGLELRRDPVTAARVVLVPSLVVAIFGGGSILLGSLSLASPLIGMALLAAPAFVVIAFIGRMQWGAEAYPNPIRQRFGTNAGEERGVQLAVVAPASIRTGEIGTLNAYLQNTWDSPRSVVLTVSGKGLWRARYPAPIEVALDPLATMELSIPFAIEETETPKIRLVTHVAVSGSGGRRRRLWRAPCKAGQPRRAFTPLQAAAPEQGTAGGIPSPIAVTGTRAELPGLPTVAARVIWRPEDGAPSLVREQ